jgi:hypothetical protein
MITYEIGQTVETLVWTRDMDLQWQPAEIVGRAVTGKRHLYKVQVRKGGGIYAHDAIRGPGDLRKPKGKVVA